MGLPVPNSSLHFHILLAVSVANMVKTSVPQRAIFAHLLFLNFIVTSVNFFDVGSEKIESSKTFIISIISGEKYILYESVYC